MFHGAVLHYQRTAGRHGVAYLGKSNASVIHELGKLFLVAVGHFYYDTGVLCEKGLHDVAVLAQVVEVYVKTACLVGETHLKQCRHETACADVVACHYPSLAYHLLDSLKGIGEILGVLYRRYVVAYLAKALCEGGTAKTLLVEGEVDMVQARSLVVYQHWGDDLAYVAYLASCTDDDCSWTYHLLSVRILLAHGERVFSRGDVDVDVAAEIGQCLDCRVEAGILSLLRAAWPHPVG